MLSTTGIARAQSQLGDPGVEALLVSYGVCLNKGDWAKCAALFESDGTLFYARGAGEIAERLKADAAVFSGRRTYKLGKVTILMSGADKATAASDLAVEMRDKKGIWTDRVTYRYFDQLSRRDGKWHFVHREHVPFLSVHNDGHVGAKMQPGTPAFAGAAGELIGTYGACVDTGEPTSCVSALFSDNGSVGSAQGRQAIETLVKADVDRRGGGAQFIANTLYHQDGADHGYAVSDVMLYRKGPTDVMLWPERNRYFDQFVRVGGAWKFSHREVIPVGR
jgi:hypothetical protein